MGDSETSETISGNPSIAQLLTRTAMTLEAAEVQQQQRLAALSHLQALEARMQPLVCSG